MKKYKSIVVFMILLLCFDCIYATPGKGKNDNVAPAIDLNVAPAKKPVDIVILTDYTGTKLTALNTQINALKAQFSAVNVDPKFYIISDIKTVGTQNDELYEFVRYGRFDVTYSYYAYYKDYGLEDEYAPYTDHNEVEWERITALKSQVTELPVRTPRNVYFTKSDLRITDKPDLEQRWYYITIHCANDPCKSDDTTNIFEFLAYESWGKTHRKRVYGSILNEVASVDSTWTMDEKISDVSYDIYSLDFDRLNSIPLRAGSDRHMIFLSDASTKDYSKTLGNYFSFGDMTDTFKDHVKTNGFSLYGVVPNNTRDRTLNPDRILDILPLNNSSALYYVSNGSILKPLSSYGSVLYVPMTEEIGDMRDRVYGRNAAFFLMEDGTVKMYDSSTQKLLPIEGIADAVKIYNFPLFSRYDRKNAFNDSLYILNSSGEVFYWENGTLTPFNNTVAISEIININPSDKRSSNIYITAAGVPYMEYSRYGHDGKEHLLTRAKIKNGETVRNMPTIKDATYFVAQETTKVSYWDYYTARIMPMLVLYASGTIQQFPEMERVSVESGSYVYDYYYFVEDTAASVLETNVESIDGNDVSVFIFKKDGTIRMLNADWIETEVRYYDDDDDSHYGMAMVPFLKNMTVSVPLSNIVKTYHAKNLGRYFFWDSDNNVYMYDGTNRANTPALGTTLINLGNNITKIISNFSYSYGNFIFILYNDGRVREYKISTSEKLEIASNKLLPDTGIKNIYVSGGAAWLLNENGVPKYRINNLLSFGNVFTNNLTFDTAKSYLSLLDLFNEISNAKFYPAGGYATAFNDIYKNYNYSTGGNMYMVLGDSIKYESAYDDYENDPEYGRKWKISHDPYHFDNSMGLSAHHNPAGFATNPPAKLDKVGKYVINLYARDNPKSDLRFLSDTDESKNYYKWSLGNHNLTVYIHRKPVALQRVTVSNNGNGTFTVKALDAGSYDPDHSVTRADKGIAAREWRWREETSTTWTTGQMNKADCKPDAGYITQLRVKDIEGVWSDYATITIDRNNPPAALFNIDKRVISISEPLKVKDQSYPQSLSDIVRWHWVVKKLNADGSVPAGNIQNGQFADSNAGTGSLTGYDINVKTNYGSTGKYRMYLRVKDSNGLWSDGGTDSLTPADLTKYYSLDFEVDCPPAADFVIEKNPIYVEETLKLKDLSRASGTSPLAKWHWTVKKLDPDGTVPAASIQNEQFEDSNTGTGESSGYDVNVKTSYADKGAGTYRIYLRVMNRNGIWSEEEKYEDLAVQESFKISGFRVVRIRDLHLEPYYSSNGAYIDRPFYVDSMAIDPSNFMTGGIGIVPGFSSLTKGYRFEFEIDSVNFNEAEDTIVITPSFFPYTSGVPGIRGNEADLYWEDSDKSIHRAGEGSHSRWAAPTLDSSNRTITEGDRAIWRGEYFIPATSWLVPLNTAADRAKSEKLEADIIVNFTIRGYRKGELKYDYNLQQWPAERTVIKNPYEIGDVIRYDHTKSSLEDNSIILNRP